MTVSTELSHEEYVGNGVTTDFDFRFRIFESKHLIVVVADSEGNETTLKNGTDYTIVGVGSYHGGKVVLNKPLAQGWKILLERDLPVVQETDLRNQGKFFAEVHEDAFDYLTMLIQKALGTFSLSLRKPTYLSNYYDAKGNRIANLAPPKLGTDATNKDYVDNSIKDIDSKTLRVKDKPINALPNTEQRANKILAFDDNGQPITVLPESGSASDVLIELDKPTGASMIGMRSNKSIQYEIDSLYKSIKTLPSKFSIAYSEDIVGFDYAQGLAETDNYWFIGYDNEHAGHVKRICKSDFTSIDSGIITSSHLQGIAVIDDDTIMVGGYNDGEIISYSFITGISTTITTIGFRKDYPFCWDGEYIYQMQNIDQNISAGNFYYVAKIIPGDGISGRLTMERKYVKQGYIQSIDIFNEQLFFFTGGSFTGNQKGNKNIATLYKTSLSGELMDVKMFYKTSFISNFGDIQFQSYESQSVSIYKNNISLLCYISGKLKILVEDINGKSIGYLYGSKQVTYYGISEIDLDDTDLVTDPIAQIVNAMVDNSIMIQPISSSTPRLQGAVEYENGMLYIEKITNYRAVARFYYGGSDFKSPKHGISYVFGTSSTPFYYARMARKHSPSLYESKEFVVIGMIPIKISLLNRIVIELTQVSPTNAVSRQTFEADDINHAINNSVPYLMEINSSSIIFKFTLNGINITEVSGNPIIKFIYGS